ncbi:TorF family putative porin [Phenylobacterium sp.]|uniref:TorF family putative porin n=1 Tax=Phenylobacterium sp. TaxID=1871053 RepID=UPI00286A9EF0|nr:TorF family putative porin [Phenylobacterium sp.]
MTFHPFAMTKHRLFAMVCGGLALSVAVGAGRASAEEPTVSFNLGVASDYVFRGVSQTDESLQVFGGGDLTAGQFYAGVWGSNVDFHDSTDAEIDVYAGFKPTLGPVTLDLGVIYYGYVNAPSGADDGNWEAKLAGSMPLGAGRSAQRSSTRPTASALLTRRSTTR